MNRFILSGTVICLFSSLTINAQQTKIVVQQGQKFITESTVQLSTSAEAMGQSMESSTESKSTTVYEVTGVKTGGYDLTETISKLKVDAAFMGQNMGYDSERKDNSGPIADMLNNVVNKTRSIELNEKGEITKQDASTAPDLGPVNLGMGVNDVTIDLFIPALIGKELKAGDSINDITYNTKDKYSAKDSGTYTIITVDNGVASISYTGTQMSTSVIEQMGMEMTSNSNNKVNKELQVDIKTGIVIMKKNYGGYFQQYRCGRNDHTINW